MQHILISRTDAIGDVVLTLPVCGLIKRHLPAAKISFLGNTYTKEVISACKFVDNFVNYNDWVDDDTAIKKLKALEVDAIIHVFPKKRIAYLAYKAEIPVRVGTRNRLYHWLYCNKLIKLSRKNSQLHESQLNIKLLKGLEIELEPQLSEIQTFYGLQPIAHIDTSIEGLLSKDKFNLIIHPKSAGSAKEWPLEHYTELIRLLNPDRYQIFITGSEKEKGLLVEWIKDLGNKVIDLTGKFSLSELISFISQADGLVAASTGPVHLAAAVGINALGLYPNSSSINAKRWGPVGKRAGYLQAEDININTIRAESVLNAISDWKK